VNFRLKSNQINNTYKFFTSILAYEHNTNIFMI